MTLNLTLPAALLQEDFGTDPSAQGWQVFGNPALFVWSAAEGNLHVTWDSRQPNSYFFRRLGTVLSQTDDFSVAFDLRLTGVTPGIDPLKTNAPFQIAVGLIRVADATAPGFVRGSGFQSPNLVEFNYFPDPGGEWQWGPSLMAVICDRTGAHWSDGGFAGADLPLGDTVRVAMHYAAASRTLSTTLHRNGQPFLTLPPATLTNTAFTDLRVDAVAVCSYSDAGQWPGFEGSILAQGTVDNFVLNLPAPPVERLAAGPANAPGQIQFASQSNWLYVLERTLDFTNWQPVSVEWAGDGGALMLQDTNPPLTHAFYRVRARRP